MMGGSMLWMHGWGGLLSLVVYLAIVSGFVLLLVWAIKRITGSSNTTLPGAQSPRDIVQLRYARGEVTREQYQQILNDLD
jgi:putative membrane protein